MLLLSKIELQYHYDWLPAKEHDTPLGEYFPDDRVFARQEGYEVLNYINQVAQVSNWTRKSDGYKLERMLRRVPSELRSYCQVHEWVKAQWHNAY